MMELFGDDDGGDDELRTSVYPSNLAPIGAKLRQRAFRKIFKFRSVDAENFVDFFFFGVETSKAKNRPKRVLPKFRSDRSDVRGVNGRSKFVVAAVRPKN